MGDEKFFQRNHKLRDIDEQTRTFGKKETVFQFTQNTVSHITDTQPIELKPEKSKIQNKNKTQNI